MNVDEQRSAIINGFVGFVEIKLKVFRNSGKEISIVTINDVICNIIPGINFIEKSSGRKLGDGDRYTK
jgi:hypothetical protein